MMIVTEHFREKAESLVVRGENLNAARLPFCLAGRLLLCVAVCVWPL